MASTSGQRKSTIYDIATATGTSPATSSMVLNGIWQRYRISEATAVRILDTAHSLDYNVNMKVRGLRLARSGLICMIMPHHRNRFFAGLSETFEAGARGFCPMVVSTQRQPETERQVVERLLSHRIEFLFSVGVAHSDPLNDLCRVANIPSVNIDLPNSNAPSVVTDNQGNARMLTDILLDKIIASFPDTNIHRCGYWPETARVAVEDLCNRLDGLPARLFINSITAFGGAVQVFRSLDPQAFDGRFIGCFDWDPFAAFLPFPVTMLRQNVEALVEQGFAGIENYRFGDYLLFKIPLQLSASHAKPPATQEVPT